jgi:hypothetical protein
LVLGSANYTLHSGWVEQSFKFQPPSTKYLGNKSVGCPFGLVQNKGGPCGILAVVQAYIIKVSSSVFFVRSLSLEDYNIFEYSYKK